MPVPNGPKPDRGITKASRRKLCAHQHGGIACGKSSHGEIAQGTVSEHDGIYRLFCGLDAERRTRDLSGIEPGI